MSAATWDNPDPSDGDRYREVVLAALAAATRSPRSERGERVIIETVVRGRRVLVVLYPRHSAMGDEWNLGSAYWAGS